MDSLAGKGLRLTVKARKTNKRAEQVPHPTNK